MEINVTAKEFIQVVFSDRQEQSNVLGKWFSPKETGKQLRTKAKKVFGELPKLCKLFRTSCGTSRGRTRQGII